MPLILPARTLDSGYEIDNSLRFNDADTPSLTLDLSGGAGNRKTWTASFWFKLGNMDSSGVSNQRFLSANTSHSDTNYGQIGLGSGDYLEFGTGTQIWRRTNRLFRDPSAWYHIVVAMDTTQGTASNRVKMYINGVQETSFAISNDPTQDADYGIMGAVSHAIGKTEVSGQTDNETFDGYMAEWHFIDGSALAETKFGETNDNGVWIPKAYSGSYGTNGFKLEFQDSGNLGDDTSGNTNDFTANNLTATDQTTDTPTNNFCTWNPLVVRGGSDDLVYTEGNTGVSSNQHATNNYTFGTQGFANGKWYWEVKCETVGGEMHIGIVDSGSSTTGYPSIYREYRNNGQKRTNTGSASSFGNTYTDGDIIGVAVDLDNTSIYFAKNGTWQNSGNPESGASKTGAAFTDISSTNFSNFVLPWVAGAGVNGGADVKAFANFGNPPFSISSGNSDANGYGNFEYAVPSGYYSLCTKNLAEYG